MNNEIRGLAGTVERVAKRGREVRAHASNIVDAAAERGRHVYDSTVNGTADAMSSASDTVEAVGEKARSTGIAIRQRSKRAARAIHRREMTLRDSDPRAIVDATAAAVRRHSFAFAVAGAAMLAFLTMKFLRHGNSTS